MVVAILLLAQAAPVPQQQAPAAPCHLIGPRGKPVFIDPKLCEQFTWDQARIPAPSAGATTLELDIDATGRAVHCRIVERSGTPALDARACAIAVEEARYRPTADADGTSPLAHRRLKVTWR
jgi:predicted kinase